MAKKLLTIDVHLFSLSQIGERTLLGLLHEMVKITEQQKTLGLVRADVDFIPIG